MHLFKCKMIFVLLCVLEFQLNAQTKGDLSVELGNTDPEHGTINQLTETGVTRAVVIGISKYQQNERDLKFADDDARAFVTFLMSKAGGLVSRENIHLLLNDTAFDNSIIKEIKWLERNSKEGDKAIFYFSGHGGRDNEVARNGFLICYNSPMPEDGPYVSNAIGYENIQTLINKLLTKKVETFILLDACKSGSLSYKEFISDYPENPETKLFRFYSCQSDENSYEDSIWAHKVIQNCSGGGAFTFNLIMGLYGFADDNSDGQVTLNELDIFMNRNVVRQTDNNEKKPLQYPLILGNKGYVLSRVDATEYEHLKGAVDLNDIGLKKKPVSRGWQKSSSSDTLVSRLINDIHENIESRNKIDPIDLETIGLYKLGSGNSDTSEALQEKIDQLVLDLVELPSTIMKSYLKGQEMNQDNIKETFQLANQYLSAALVLMGADDIFYNDIKAKQLFFEGISEVPDSIQKAISTLHQAFQYVPNAPYIFLELGNIYYQIIGDSSKAEICYLRASMYADKWVNPIFNLGNLYYHQNNFQKACIYFDKALSIRSEHVKSLVLRGNCNYKMKKYVKAIADWEKAIKINPDYYKTPLNTFIKKAKEKLKD
jgi:tetratricopeptide (TPR) repeat protein